LQQLLLQLQQLLLPLGYFNSLNSEISHKQQQPVRGSSSPLWCFELAAVERN